MADDQNVSITVPTVARVSLDEHTQAAADRMHPATPEKAGRIKQAAVRLDPLQKIQTALDQLQRHSEDHGRGLVWDHAGSSFVSYRADVIEHVRELRDSLIVAADAAESMIGEMSRQLDEQGDAMAKKKEQAPVEATQEPPQLTTDGSPHPLVEGGYDAASDPNLSPNESDVAALAAGHTTRQQTEALNAASAADTGESDDEESADDEDDEEVPADKPKKRGRPKKS